MRTVSSMKIDSLSSTQSSSAKRRTAKARGADGAFSSLLDESGKTRSVSAGGPAGAVDALLSLQEVEGEVPDQRQRSCEHAEDILDRLEELRLGLLTGRLSQPLLERIGQLLSARPAESGDPELEAILQDIELRAAVELAKLQR